MDSEEDLIKAGMEYLIHYRQSIENILGKYVFFSEGKDLDYFLGSKITIDKIIFTFNIDTTTYDEEIEALISENGRYALISSKDMENCY